jgi:tetratricopeptide (TPR) repeat protein
MSKKSRARAAAKSAPQTASGAKVPSASPAQPSAACPDVRWKIFLAGSIIVLATLAAYHNSLSGPFIFDDVPGIQENATIRHLRPIWRALTPPHEISRDSGLPVAGRPLVNLSLAVNYAAGGLAVRGYHTLNLAIHILAALVLFGVVRRTLLQPRLRDRFGDAAGWLALAIAGLWSLHPLQTESVTYIVQRAESLMGLFYLLTLYCFIRGTKESEPRVQSRESRENPASPGISRIGSRLSTLSSRLWYSASILSCLLGMASKEVMVSAPLIVLLYDRTFVARTFRAAWSRRWPYYSALAATWLLLGWLVASTRGRGGTAGFGADITWWSYALTQFRAIAHYLQLSLWPHPLVLDYGTALATRAAEIVPYAIIVTLLLAGTVFALRRRPAIGFSGAWFFAILAPSSSVVPVVTQTVAEHRMYLALVPLVALAVAGLYSLLGRRSAVIFLALAAGLGCATSARNRDYRSTLAIWSDTAKKCPGNVRAHYILGHALWDLGRSQEATTEFQSALRLKPDYAQAHNSLANVLEKIPGRLPEAISEHETAVRLEPNFAEAHYDLALAIQDIPGRRSEAIAEYETALRLKPDFPEAQINLGSLWQNIPGRLSAAIAEYETAIQNHPDLAEAHFDLGNAWSNLPGRMPDAISEYETVLRLKPNFAEAQYRLGVVLAQTGRLDDGIGHLEESVRIRPDYLDACTALGTALVQARQYPEAITRFQQALKIRPGYIYAYNNLGTALLRVGRFSDAAGQFEAALKIDPNFSTARLNLGFTLARMNRRQDAIQQLESVVRTNANDENAAAAKKLLSQLQPANDDEPQKN